MFTILLSGGSGKRLWPLSNETRSKQFLKVLASDDGCLISMVQRVWKQLKKCGLDENTIIATGEGQVEILKSQVGEEVPMVLEPERRDTFPAISLACSYVKSIMGADDETPIAVLPVDPFVEDDYFLKLKELSLAVNKIQADIFLMGVTPVFPSEKYGYIIRDTSRKEEYYRVKKYKEKPLLHEAQKLIEEGALWNCGVFVFKLGYVLDKLRLQGFPTKFNDLYKVYDELPKISFDYKVVEKAEKVFVFQYEGNWKDLGTWNTLTEEMTSNAIGKVHMSSSCSNTHVINELDIPVVVIGAKDLAIAASVDGILVTNKNESSKLKECIEGVSDCSLLKERRWGWYRTLETYDTDEGKSTLVRHICIKSGFGTSIHCHNYRNETWTITCGEGLIILNDDIMKVKSGMTINVAAGIKHGIKADKRIEMIEVQHGMNISEDDTIRLSIDW